MLHDNREEFKRLLEGVSEDRNIRPDILEKDYYVSLMLSEIASKQDDIPMFFKGGTALYKILDFPRRFSEDIDLTVNVAGMSRSKAKRTLEKASNAFTCLPRLKGDEMEENHRGSITAVYGYDSVFQINKDDPLQRFGKLKIEATSFTVSEPIDRYEISSMIYDFLDKDGRKELANVGCSAFYINTIAFERMFCDKLLAAEYYALRGEYFDVAKHVYDLSLMMTCGRISDLMSDKQRFIEILSYKRIEEISRLGSELDRKPLNELIFFSDIQEGRLSDAYEKMQSIYIFNPIYRISEDVLKKDMSVLKEYIDNISDREQQYLDSIAFIQKKSAYVGINNNDVTSPESAGNIGYDER